MEQSNNSENKMIENLIEEYKSDIRFHENEIKKKKMLLELVEIKLKVGIKIDRMLK